MIESVIRHYSEYKMVISVAIQNVKKNSEYKTVRIQSIKRGFKFVVEV